MTKQLLHRPALRAILDVATGPRRWRSHAQIATDSGFAPSTLSGALNGHRGLSDETLTALCAELGIDPDALLVPWVARPGDLRSDEIVRQLHATQDALTDLHRAVIAHRNGD